MKKCDLSYRDVGLFTTFYPESEAGHAAWNEMAEQNDGVATVLSMHSKSVIAQLKAAGYSVRKNRRKLGSLDANKLLAELES